MKRYIIVYTDKDGNRKLMNWCADKKQCKRYARMMKREDRSTKPYIRSIDGLGEEYLIA